MTLPAEMRSTDLLSFAVGNARAEFKKPAPPTLPQLIEMARDSHSPTERVNAVRAAYLMGGVHALDGKANATYDAATSVRSREDHDADEGDAAGEREWLEARS